MQNKNYLKPIDSHIHLWDLKLLEYEWLNNFPKIKHNFLLTDYDVATKGYDVEKMVFVQAECHSSQFLEEVKWVQNLADSDPRLSGIVPWAPLHTGNAVEEILEIFKQDPRIKGIRQLIQPQKDINFCLRPDFVSAVRLLGEYNLHFELTIAPDQFPSVLKLVELCPGTNFILDHIGNPNIHQSQLKPWKSYIQNFALSGHHYCKFSNFVCNADLDNWRIDDLKPYSETVLDAFGSDRLIWGSDWPHALRASSWSRWYETAQELTEGLTELDRIKIFRENAIQFYNLK